MTSTFFNKLRLLIFNRETLLFNVRTSRIKYKLVFIYNKIMNAVLGLSHFCETHGPTVLFSTQAFHFVGESESGVLEPFGTRFFGCLKKLGDYNAGLPSNVNLNVACEACESVSGYVTNDYRNKISFLSTKLAIDPNVSSLLKQAAVRSLSCEIVPGKEGQVYFGDPVRGHVLSNTFFLKDAQARGFHRWYSVVVFMRDKHFLLNSWAFFQKHISKLIAQLQKKADQVYMEEQTKCSQRAFRLTSLDQKHSVARSLVKLTASINIFVQLHLWFTWLLSIGAQRLEEHLPTKALDCKLNLSQVGGLILVEESEGEVVNSREDPILCLRLLRQIFGVRNFQKVLYSTLTGQQVIVRGPRSVVDQIIGLLKLFLPAEKFRCQEFGETYKTPDICNIVGLDLCAAVPKSSEAIIRLDIVPNRHTGERKLTSSEDFKFYHFLVKTERELPEKLPSLLVKIDKTLSDESLTNRVALLHITSLLEQWLHLAEVVQEAKKRQTEFYFTDLLQYLGIPDQDEQLIEFWTS